MAQFGEMPAAEFGPRSLRTLRDSWEKSGRFCRRYINTRTNTVIRFFRNAVANELCDESVHRRLRTLEPLRKGQSSARENPERQAADLEIIRQTVKHMTPTLRDMVAIQVSTGMRPSELLSMRPCDIDRSGEVWLYQPASHKNINKGKTCTKAKVKPWTPYEIRHLTAVAVRDALGLESSQVLLGHSDIRTTQRYAKQTTNSLIEAAKAAPRLEKETKNE